MRPSLPSQTIAGGRMVCDIEPSHDHFAIIPQISPKSRNVLASRLSRRKDQTDVCSFEVSVTVLQDVRKRLEPQLRRIFHLYWRIARGMTLGGPGLVLGGDNRVVLV